MSLIIDGTSGVTFNDASLQGAAASPYVLKNRIINGDMRIDQRNAGASVTPTTSGQYVVDRWKNYLSQSSKFSQQQLSASPPVGFSNYLGTTSLSAYSVSATDYFTVTQAIEAFNTADLVWGTANAKTVTLSFQVYSSLTGTFGGTISNAAFTRCYPFSYSISTANTWTTISVTIAGDTSGTWTGNVIGIQVNFGLGVGSTYLGTAGSWSSTQYFSATGATSVVGTNGATFYITGVQLEIGSTATPFERRLYNQELANCQRYCLKLGGDSAYVPYGTGNNYSTTNGSMVVNFPVSMRSTPTLTVTAPNRVLSGSGATSVSAMSLSNGGALAVYVDYTSTGLTVGYGSYITSNGSTAGNLLFSAEL